MTIETLLPAGGIGDEDELAPIQAPLWLRRLRVAGLLFGGLGAVLFVAIGSGLLTGRPVLAGALFFALLALMSAIAVFVSRMERARSPAAPRS